MTNAEPEVTGRYSHIMVIMPPGLAVAITASVDQTAINAVRGMHKQHTPFSLYKTTAAKGMGTAKLMIIYAKDLNARLGELGLEPRHLGDIADATEFIDSIPHALRARYESLWWAAGVDPRLDRVSTATSNVAAANATAANSQASTAQPTATMQAPPSADQAAAPPTPPAKQ